MSVLSMELAQSHLKSLTVLEQLTFDAKIFKGNNLNIRHGSVVENIVFNLYAKFNEDVGPICSPGLSCTDNMRHTDFVTWS